MGEIYFLNVGCGDCTIIRSVNSTILVDCAEGIANHLNLLPDDHKIEAVFITHHHYDHFFGLWYLKEKRYTIKHLIHSPYTWRQDDSSFRKEEWLDFKKFRNYFVRHGTKCSSPYRQTNIKNPAWEIDGIKFFILGPYRHMVQAQKGLHNGCLVILAELGNRKCMFTGDASDNSLEEIALDWQHSCDDILHASHHGSINGAEWRFIQKCNPAYTIISTGPNIHQLPDSAALALYENNTHGKVFRTDEDGSILATWTPSTLNRTTITVPLRCLYSNADSVC